MRDQGRSHIRCQRPLAQTDAADRVGEVARGRGDECKGGRREAIEGEADKRFHGEFLYVRLTETAVRADLIRWLSSLAR